MSAFGHETYAILGDEHPVELLLLLVPRLHHVVKVCQLVGVVLGIEGLQPKPKRLLPDAINVIFVSILLVYSLVNIILVRRAENNSALSGPQVLASFICEAPDTQNPTLSKTKSAIAGQLVGDTHLGRDIGFRLHVSVPAAPTHVAPPLSLFLRLQQSPAPVISGSFENRR